MQGLNPITMQCTYSTPCGWCTKWDKKCDKKIGCGDEKPLDNNSETDIILKELPGTQLTPHFGVYQ